MNDLISGSFLGLHVQTSVPFLDGIGQTIDSKTETRQDFVINNVFEEHGIRVKRVFLQDDAIGKCLVFVNDIRPLPLLRSL
jgi:hypothetical protein